MYLCPHFANRWLLTLICKYIPLKQWAFDDSHFPKYEKFKTDTHLKIILNRDTKTGKKIPDILLCQRSTKENYLIHQKYQNSITSSADLTNYLEEPYDKDLYPLYILQTTLRELA